VDKSLLRLKMHFFEQFFVSIERLVTFLFTGFKLMEARSIAVLAYLSTQK
jgi:hypothetical protein